MTIQECYKKMGADYQEVLGRLHNEAMIGRFVRMFLQDDSFQILEEALRRGDVKEAFRGAHTLKGVCQNLGFSNLYAPAYTLTETLRAGSWRAHRSSLQRWKSSINARWTPSVHWTKMECGVGRLSGCPALFFYRICLKAQNRPLYRRVVCGMIDKKEGRRLHYVQTYPCLSAHQRRAEDPH